MKDSAILISYPNSDTFAETELDALLGKPAHSGAPIPGMIYGVINDTGTGPVSDEDCRTNFGIIIDGFDTGKPLQALIVYIHKAQRQQWPV